MQLLAQKPEMTEQDAGETVNLIIQAVWKHMLSKSDRSRVDLDLYT
jgi:hypothetical protein